MSLLLLPLVASTWHTPPVNNIMPIRRSSHYYLRYKYLDKIPQEQCKTTRITTLLSWSYRPATTVVNTAKGKPVYILSSENFTTTNIFFSYKRGRRSLHHHRFESTTSQVINYYERKLLRISNMMSKTVLALCVVVSTCFYLNNSLSKPPFVVCRNTFSTSAVTTTSLPLNNLNYLLLILFLRCITMTLHSRRRQ